MSEQISNEWGLPHLDYFENGGIYTGSRSYSREREFRYRVSLENEALKVFLWYGPYCFEKSTMEKEENFPDSEEGYEALLLFLTDSYQTMAS